MNKFKVGKTKMKMMLTCDGFFKKAHQIIKILLLA